MVILDGCTSVDSVSESGSVFEPSAVAVLLTDPSSPASAVGLTCICTVSVCPAPIVPKLHVIVPLPVPSGSEEHDATPTPGEAETNVVLAGKVSVSTTFSAPFPPVFCTNML